MRKLTSAVTAVALLGLGLTAAGASAAPGTSPSRAAAAAHQPKNYDPPPIKWGRCDSASLRDAGAKCGMLKVPLDYAKPGGKKIKLAVSRIKHKTSDRKAQGPMLVNPGGPGGSGLGLARLGSAVPKKAGDAYDWIGFDPRGVGSSKPSLSCDTDYTKAGRPTYVPSAGSDTEKFWLDKASAYVKDCKKAGGALLKHMHTTDWVADMDSIRKALGAKRINFYGFSYGTYLAQVYATQYPQRVRRFVLDGVVDPRDVWYDANLEQDKQFDKNINTYFDWIAENNATYGLGTDGAAVRAIYYNVLDQLTTNPLPDFGAADWNDVFVSAGYYVYDWDTIAHVLVAAAHGDLQPAKDAYGDPTGPGADNTYANYLAVQCTDAPWPQKWSTWERDSVRLHQTAPFLTWNNAWYNAPCIDWPVKASKPVTVKGKHVAPILLISETDDSATPYAGALRVRKLFPKSVLIEGVGGTTHAGSLSGVTCTDNRVARYLLTGKLPKRVKGNRSDVRCQPVPPPAPTAPGATARRLPTQDRLGPLRDLITDTAAHR